MFGLLLLGLVACEDLGLSKIPGEDTGGSQGPVSIDRIEPHWGPTEGGTVVAIFGEGFEGDLSVSFGRAVVDVTRVGADELMVVSPLLGFEESVDVTVVSDLGEAVLSDGFTYTDGGEPLDTGDPDSGGVGGTGGFVELSFVQYACPGCFGLTSSLDATATALFHQPVQESWLGDLPAVGSCVQDLQSTYPGTALTDAGDYVHLLSGHRTIGLQRTVDSLGTYYTASGLLESDFVSNTSYDLSVPDGGSMGSFQVEDVISTPQGWVSFSPQALLLDEPHAYTQQVSRSAGLGLSWSPSGGSEHVLVQMLFGDQTGNLVRTLTCHDTNSGAVTVPGTLMTGLPTGGAVIVKIKRFLTSSTTNPNNGSALEGIAVLGFVGTAILVP